MPKYPVSNNLAVPPERPAGQTQANMRDSDNLESQLAKEEASLAATTKQIEAAHRQIEALNAQIAATQEQIAATERQIGELADHAATIEKRMTLLREYMSMVDEAGEAPGPPPVETAPPAPPAPPAPAEPAAPPPAPDTNQNEVEVLPDFEVEPEPEDEIGDLSFETMPGATADDTNPPVTARPDSFEELSEEMLTHELLPRTQTFEEELLLVMAHHRKAVAPKEVGRIFRRLDYAPKQKATEAAIKAQVEATPHFIEYAKEGRIALTAEGRDVGLEVAGGRVVAKGSLHKSIAEVSLRANKVVAVRAHQGTVVLDIDGKVETLRPGESVSVDAKGQQQLVGRGIGFADVVLAAGQSLAVNDPDPPTAIGFTFPNACAREGVIELLGRGRVAHAAAGTGGANLRVPKGRYAYRLRCLSDTGLDSKPVAKGGLTVLHNAGTAPLAAGAPSTMVDTDGRTYTVLYQNRLPQVSVRWPHPPKASSYVLVHRSNRGTRSYTTGSPSYSFRSGSLREGRHAFTFRTGNKTSRTTTVRVRFDLAAPKASIDSPANESFGPGARVRVSGMALPHWKVMAGAVQMKLDAQRRFSGMATAGPRVLEIRFQHEFRGGELYLRRASGVPR